MEEKKEIKEKESPEDRFKRLASLRTQNALKRIKLVGNLSGPGYKYIDEQVDRIINALRGAVDEVESRFKKGKEKEAGFTL